MSSASEGDLAVAHRVARNQEMELGASSSGTAGMIEPLAMVEADPRRDEEGNDPEAEVESEEDEEEDEEDSPPTHFAPPREGSLTFNELQLAKEKYGIPKSFQCRLPCLEETLRVPRKGWVTFYVDLFEKGHLRLPLNPFLEEFLKAYELPPSAIGINAWTTLWAFLLLCQDMEELPTLRLFSLFYELKRDKDGIYYTSAKRGRRLFVTPSSTHPNREKYFVCRPRGRKWQIPTLWNDKANPEFPISIHVGEEEFIRHARSLAAAHKGGMIPTQLYCTAERLEKAREELSGEMSSEEMQLLLAANAERNARLAEERRRSSEGNAPKRAKKSAPKAPAEKTAPAPRAAPRAAPPAPRKQKRASSEVPAEVMETGEAQPVVEIETILQEEARASGSAPSKRRRTNRDSGARENLVLHINEDESFDNDDSVLGEYVNKAFTGADIDRMDRLIPRSESPCKYLARMGLNLTLATRFAEDHFIFLNNQANEARAACRQMEASRNQAVEEVRAAKDDELKELRESMEAVQKELDNKDQLLTDAMVGGVQVRNDLDRAKDDLKWARREHKKEVENLNRQLGEAGPMAVEQYKGSRDFKKDASLAFLSTFDETMQLYRSQVKNLYPNLDLSSLDEMFPGSVPSSEQREGAEVGEGDAEESPEETLTEGQTDASPEVEVVEETFNPAGTVVVNVEVGGEEETLPTPSADIQLPTVDDPSVPEEPIPEA